MPGQVRSGQVTRAGMLTPSQKSCNHAKAKAVHGALSSLIHTEETALLNETALLELLSYMVFITVPECLICISHNFHICDLSSGQSRDLFIISLWENNEMRPVSRKRVKPTQCLQDYDRLTDL